MRCMHAAKSATEAFDGGDQRHGLFDRCGACRELFLPFQKGST